MATMAGDRRQRMAGDNGFFVRAAIAMVVVIVAGFSLQLAMGRSTFASPPLVHAHAVFFMGWVAIYLAQNMLVASGNVALHQRLGWLAAAWMVPMLGFGLAVTLAMVQDGRVPFFFRPLQFLVFDPLSLVTFVGLSTAAIVLRRQTDWHRRLHFCGMATLLGPGFGRLLPMPFLIPWAFEATFVATLIFPILGVVADWRRTGRVHPAWGYGIAANFAMLVAIELVTYSPIGLVLYETVTAGTPGAAIAPLAFPPPPMAP